MITAMFRKIGLFFLLVGLIITIILFPSRISNTPSMTFFCIGIALIIVGITIWARTRDRTPAPRFRLLRTFAVKKDEKKEEE